MKGVIDRFEGDWAVLELEDKTTIDIPRNLLPPYAHEGDVVQKTAGKFKIIPEETRTRAKEVRDLMDDVWED